MLTAVAQSEQQGLAAGFFFPDPDKAGKPGHAAVGQLLVAKREGAADCRWLLALGSPAPLQQG
jgi:hypothetical protein